MKRNPGPSNGLKVLASGSLSIARAHADQALLKTEAWLEKELAWENAKPPTNVFLRFKQSGGKVLHSKHVLLAVVILNVIDCILVLSELILDIHYVTGNNIRQRICQQMAPPQPSLTQTVPPLTNFSRITSYRDKPKTSERYLLHEHEEIEGSFLKKMQDRYPTELSLITNADTLFDHIVKADVTWSNKSYIKSSTPLGPELKLHSRILRSTDHVSNSNSTDSSSVRILLPGIIKDDHSYTVDLAHGLHKASITILAILVLQTILKIICIGRHLLEKKIEVFDGFIVFASFALDLAFIKGLTAHKLQDFVFILAFIVPWRVLRVVNSLIVAVMDHEHFRLKLLYKQKKSISSHLRDSKAKITDLQHDIEKLQSLCIKSGVPIEEIQETMIHSPPKQRPSFANGLGRLLHQGQNDQTVSSLPASDTQTLIEHHVSNME